MIKKESKLLSIVTNLTKREVLVNDGTEFRMDVCKGKLGCNYLYRDSMDIYSYTDSKTKIIYSNLQSRKENYSAY